MLKSIRNYPMKINFTQKLYFKWYRHNKCSSPHRAIAVARYVECNAPEVRDRPRPANADTARNQSKGCYRHITRRTSGRLAFAVPTNFPAPEKWLKQSENR